MLDSSLSRSKLEGFKSDGSLDGNCNWTGEEDEQEAGCTDVSKDGLVTAMDDDQTTTELTHLDGGANVS